MLCLSYISHNAMFVNKLVVCDIAPHCMLKWLLTDCLLTETRMYTYKGTAAGGAKGGNENKN